METRKIGKEEEMIPFSKTAQLMEPISKKKQPNNERLIDIGGNDTFSLPNKFDDDPILNEILKNQLRLKEIIIPSTLANADSAIQTKNILEEFNKKAEAQGKSCFVRTNLRGIYIDKDEFLLGHRNRTPELAGFYPTHNTARELNPTKISIETQILGLYKITAPFYGAHGSYVINVPVNQYAKAYSGMNPVIYGPGPHVIHDNNFQFNPKTGFINQATDLIEHTTLNILRIPAGKLATVWYNNEPLFLESRDEPYVFNTPLFKLAKKNDQGAFYDTTEECIVHGRKKRLVPSINHLFVTSNNGKIEIIGPRNDNKPTLIQNPLHEVKFLFETTAKTLEFPTDKTSKKRKEENPNATPDELNLETFITTDSQKIGVTLGVAFIIEKADDVKLAFTRFSDLDAIIEHIESMAKISMNSAIQQSTSNDDLVMNVNNPNDAVQAEQNEARLRYLTHTSTPATSQINTIQDGAKMKLADELAKFGITLTRLSIKEIKQLNVEVANEMAKQAITTAKANAEKAVITQNADIAKAKAQREATTKKIAQLQTSEAIVIEAQAHLEAAKIEAQALLVKTEAEKKARELMGDLYKKHPELLQLENTRLQMDAIQKAKFVPVAMPVSASHFLRPSLFDTTNTFFSPPEEATVKMIEQSEEKHQQVAVIKQ